MLNRGRRLRALATDAAGELDVLRHDGHSLGVDGSQVGVLEKADKVSLSGLLKGKDGRSLEAEIGLEVLGNLTDKALEWQLADEKLSGLLVTSDLTESDSSRSVSVGLLDTSGGRSGFAGSLGGELLARSFTSCGFACGLLGTGHRRCELNDYNWSKNCEAHVSFYEKYCTADILVAIFSLFRSSLKFFEKCFRTIL